MATSNTAWDGLSARADEFESDVSDVQGHVRRAGGSGDGTPRFEREWDLQTKGDVKEFNGDKKLYLPWAKKVQAFCNTKRVGFRKALLWAVKLKDPIGQAELDGTN